MQSCTGLLGRYRPAMPRSISFTCMQGSNREFGSCRATGGCLVQAGFGPPAGWQHHQQEEVHTCRDATA